MKSSLHCNDSLFQSDENSFTLVKEKGKGSGKTFDILGKGKRPKNDDPKPRSEGEQLEDAITKFKMRDLCSKTAQELQLLIKEVKVTKFWSKAAQKDADNLLIGLKDEVSDLQTALLKKSKDFEKLKEVCLKSAAKVKDVQTQMKEYKGLLHKTSSKASK